MLRGEKAPAQPDPAQTHTDAQTNGPTTSVTHRSRPLLGAPLSLGLYPRRAFQLVELPIVQHLAD